MNFITLVKTLEHENVKLDVKDGALRCHLPSKSYRLSTTVVAAIKENKAQLIAFLRHKAKHAQRGELDIIKAETKAERKEKSPLACQQEGLWFIDQLETDNNKTYNELIPLQVEGPLDPTLLKTAVAKVVQEQELLRTTFLTEDEVPYQNVLQDIDIDAYFFECAASVSEIIADESNHDFDLQSGPLIRFILVASNGQASKTTEAITSEYYLLISAHHIIFDGWSIGVLVDRLSSLYSQSALEEGGIEAPATLDKGKGAEDLEIQFRDYTLWQQRWLASPAAKRQTDFWLKRLTGAPQRLRLPTSYERQKVRQLTGKRLSFDIPHATVDAISKINQGQGFTSFMTYFSVFNLLLSAYSGQSDIVLGTSVANRKQRSLEKLVGYFVNTLAIRIDVNEGRGLIDFMNNAKDRILEAMEQQELPFDKVVEALNPERNASFSPLYQVLFVLQNMDLGDMKIGGKRLSLRPELVDNNTARFDLFVEVIESGDTASIRCQYPTDLFDEQLIAGLFDDYRALLDSVSKALLAENKQINVADLTSALRGAKSRLPLQFHHIGIACQDIESHAHWIRQAFSVCQESDITWDPEQQVNLLMIELEDGSRIELVQGDTVKGFLEKEVSFYHVCYATNDIEQAINRFVNQGAVLVSPAKPAILFGGKRVAFLQTAMGLVELLEDSDCLSSAENPARPSARLDLFGRPTSLSVDGGMRSGMGVAICVDKISDAMASLHGAFSFIDEAVPTGTHISAGSCLLQNNSNGCPIYLVENSVRAKDAPFASVHLSVKDLSQVLPDFIDSGCRVSKAPRCVSESDARVWVELTSPIGSLLICETEAHEATADRLTVLGSRISSTSTFPIVVCGNFTADPIEDSLNFWADKADVGIGIELAPYNQVFQELLDPSSASRRNSGGNIILLRMDDWAFASDTGQSPASAEAELGKNIEQFCSALSQASSIWSAQCIVVSCENTRLENRAVQHFEQQIEDAVAAMAGVSFIPSPLVLSNYSVDQIGDAKTEAAGHIPFTNDYYCALGTTLFRQFHIGFRKPYKVIVLDCDNTLWRGVSGEVGAENVVIDAGFMHLQRRVIELHDQGFLLCLCSRNEPIDVWQVFDNHSDMLLKREHIVTERINWERKSENIQSIATELNLGLESFIFIDDDALQCADVRRNCPSVTTLQLPENTKDIARTIDHLWAFDQKLGTATGQVRTEQYRQEKNRNQEKSKATSLADFIASLNLQISFVEVSEKDIERTAELLIRTNQFNFNGFKLSDVQVAEWLAEPSKFAVQVRLKDRFGDYGAVGLMLFSLNEQETEKSKGKYLELNNMVLSCRALGRGVEHAMFNFLFEKSREFNVQTLHLSFDGSARNRPAHDFLTTVIDQLPDYETLQASSVYNASIALKNMTPLGLDDSSASTSSAPLKKTIMPAHSAGSDLFQSIAESLFDIAHISEAMQVNKGQGSDVTHAVYIAPESRTEVSLAETWASLLNIAKESISRKDSFFALGGHSLLATQLISRIHKIFNVDISLKQLFEEDQLIELAALIDTRLILSDSLATEDDSQSDVEVEVEVEEFIL